MHSPVVSFLLSVMCWMTANTPFFFSPTLKYGKWKPELIGSTRNLQYKLADHPSEWSLIREDVTCSADLGPLPSFILLVFMAEQRSSLSIVTERRRWLNKGRQKLKQKYLRNCKQVETYTCNTYKRYLKRWYLRVLY